SCNSSLSNGQCAVDNNECKCAFNHTSACGTLDQQSFVNLTGERYVDTSQWTCCWCPQNATYCCDNGNPFSFSFFTAPPATTVPTLYYKVILVFIRDCDQYSGNEQQLRVYLEQGIASLSRIPLVQVTANIACSTGHWPYCGVDVETIKAHHRAKRLVGGRMKGKSSKKNNEQKSQNSYREPSYLTCTGLAANITVQGKNLTTLETSLGLLRRLLSNNSLVIPLWDGRSIHPSFMLSAVQGSSYSLHQAPATDQPLAPTNELPPIEVDLKPLFYALGGILGLIFLCVFWKFLKHSWLLYRRKFTPINSDRVDHKKVQQLQRIMEAMEENDSKSIGRCIKNAIKMRKLLIRDTKFRFHGSSRLSNGIENPGFINDNATASARGDNKNEATKYSDKNRNKPTSQRNANGYLHSELNVRTSEERKGSVVSSDLSSNADENTAFLPLKYDKTTKQQPSEKPKKSGNLLSSSNTERKVRRSSISPSDEKANSPKLSETEVNTKKKSSTLQDVRDPDKRKPSSAADYEIRIATPKDKYKKREKNTKAIKQENEIKADDRTTARNGEISTSRIKEKLATSVSARRKSKISADEEVKVSEKTEEKNDQLTVLASQGRRKSVVSSATKIASSLVIDEGKAKGSEKNKTTKPESKDGETTKRKKKKIKRQKDNKKSVEDLDDISDLEEELKGFTSFNVIPASPEMWRSTSVTTATGDAENKKKKKNRKKKVAIKGKNEDSENSDEDVEDMIKQLNENFVAPETTRRKSVAPEETERKKKKPKKSKSTRNRPENAVTQSDEETKGDFTRRARNVQAESLSVKPEKKRKKSIVLEDMEEKLETNEETFPNSEHSRSMEDGNRSETPQNYSHLQTQRISPIPTGYKSPLLVIKPTNQRS
ncbi:unnamed protein product, partial [Porites evermanni]